MATKNAVFVVIVIAGTARPSGSTMSTTIYPDRDDHDVRSMVDMIERAVARRCPSSLWLDRRDIAQTVVARVLRILDNPETRPELGRGYFETSARNAVYSALRAKARRRAVFVLGPVSDPGCGGATSPERSVERREIASAIAAALDRLPEHRRVAVIAYLEGRGVTEIARRFGWKRKRADNLVHRGLLAVRGYLRAQGLDPRSSAMRDTSR